ncbi:MAG: hypothetical protein M1813_002346 [Trichoglossum hirsutum]|nr:MAG: hypothetical protein M1813_002346 [Trichoglossum hirsutum]
MPDSAQLTTPMSNQPSERTPPSVFQAATIFLATRRDPIPSVNNCFPKPGSAEYNPKEVRKAFQTATTYLRRFNIKEADAYMSSDDTGGYSVVSVRSVYRGPTSCERWFHDLQTAVADNFHCVRRILTLEHGEEMIIAFMGIKENAASAALTFEKLHNAFEHWGLSRSDPGERTRYREELVEDVEKAVREIRMREDHHSASGKVAVTALGGGGKRKRGDDERDGEVEIVATATPSPTTAAAATTPAPAPVEEWWSSRQELAIFRANATRIANTIADKDRLREILASKALRP